jgi:hypothetical protein
VDDEARLDEEVVGGLLSTRCPGRALKGISGSL